MNTAVEMASIQLAERICRGMADCTPTYFAARGLLKGGRKVGGPVISGSSTIRAPWWEPPAINSPC
jgi:hypothetical protein